jgi:cyclophilin family peptidyl-prolyl cis-trans isomerase
MMWDRIWYANALLNRQIPRQQAQPTCRSRRRPLVEVLEGRQLLTASLAPLSNISVPAQLGFQVSLNGSGNSNPTQTYTVTSDNPKIAATIASGPYWTFNVQHTASSQPGDISFAGALTFQLFEDLTPNTVANITKFTTAGWYNGKDFTRIANNFPGPTDFVAQGGAANPDGTGTTPFPNFNDEFVQQVTFTGTQQLAMANAGPNTNNTQVFATTGTPTFLDFKHTVFGQLVAGSNILADMTQVVTQANPALGGEKSLPVSPIVINSATLSSTNVNGVIHIDTSSASAGDTANITVKATDPKDGTTQTESFKVTVTTYNGPTDPPINFVPFANPVTSSTQIGTPVTVQLSGKSGYPDTAKPATLTFKLLSQPAHGTVSQFDASTGTFVYTPTDNFFGMDTLQYEVQSTGPQATPALLTSLPATVTLSVGAVNTGSVRLIDNVLVVTPPPKPHHATDNIVITQVADTSVPGGQKILVTVNGVPDLTQPASSSLIQIVVFGTKANDNVQVDPSVTVPTTIDGGHGGKNVLKAGGGTTLEHGWFGFNVMIGGTGSNELIGRKGHVRFRPSTASTLIYAGNANPAASAFRPIPPGATYFRFVKGHLIPVTGGKRTPHHHRK